MNPGKIILKTVLLTLSIFLSNAKTNDTEDKYMFDDFYTNKRVLITGGCGFIGSHIAEKLVELGAQVTILDDLSTGFIENITPFKDRLSVVYDSICNQETCNRVTQNQDIIFHLAAFISVPESIEKPYKCHEINVDGTVNLLEAARKNMVKRFIFSSSCAVYGPKDGRCSESDACAPTSPYGMSKLVGELYCAQYANHFDMTTVMLRYFNVFGPRQNPHGQYAGVVAKFTEQMKHNKPITIFGDGSQTRDFVPVDEVVYANLLVGMAPQELVRAHMFNIATGNSINLLELKDLLQKKYPDFSGQTIFKPARSGDVQQVYADCTRFAHLKSYVPTNCSR